jgi:hypothetical protein
MVKKFGMIIALSFGAAFASDSLKVEETLQCDSCWESINEKEVSLETIDSSGVLEDVTKDMIQSLAFTPDAPKEIKIEKEIGDYFLYWNTAYSMKIGFDQTIVIEPPKGYYFEGAIAGNTRMYKVQFAKNRVAVKKLSFDKVSTNLILLLKCPDGVSRSVAMRVKGVKSSKVSIVRLVIPTSRTVNKTVLEMKAKYLNQMKVKLQNTIRIVEEKTYKEMMESLQIYRFDGDLDDTMVENKGADFRIDGMVLSDDEAFIYMSTSADDRKCQIVDLLEVSDEDGLINKRAELIHAKKENKRTVLVYKVSKLPPGEWEFKVKVWSEEFTIDVEIELAGEEDE